jgi:thiol-disulfide isomerase/thioredoxin
MKIKVMDKDSAEQLSSLLKKGDWVVLYYSEHCGHCKDMKPEWDRFELDVPDKVNVAKVENQGMDDLKFNPRVMGYPTIKMYKNAKEVDEFVGERKAEKFKEFVKKNSNDDSGIENKNEINKKKIKKKEPEEKFDRKLKNLLNNNLNNNKKKKISHKKKKLTKKLQKQIRQLENLQMDQVKKELSKGKISKNNNADVIKEKLGKGDKKFQKKKKKITKKIQKQLSKIEKIENKEIQQKLEGVNSLSKLLSNKTPDLNNNVKPVYVNDDKIVENKPKNKKEKENIKRDKINKSFKKNKKKAEELLKNDKLNSGVNSNNNLNNILKKSKKKNKKNKNKRPFINS